MIIYRWKCALEGERCTESRPHAVFTGCHKIPVGVGCDYQGCLEQFIRYGSETQIAEARRAGWQIANTFGYKETRCPQHPAASSRPEVSEIT